MNHFKTYVFDLLVETSMDLFRNFLSFWMKEQKFNELLK